MHMADALISPAVGGAFWVVSCITAARAVKRVRADGDDQRNIFMGVLAAFVFAAQMINFTIPGTGSSGHIGGGILLALFLGRERGFLSMAVILSVQALVFADGGLLALGCNLFNLGFLPCYVVYPLISRRLASDPAGGRPHFAAQIAAAVASLELGALFVVFQTIVSGVTMIPFAPFAALMLSIHLAIAAVEGTMTALITAYVLRNEPTLLAGRSDSRPEGSRIMKKVVTALVIITIFIGGCLSWYASSQPDGLEWSLERASENSSELQPRGIIHVLSARMQDIAAVLPDYSFKSGEHERLGVSVSGVIGSFITLFFAAGAALVFGRRIPRK